MVIKNISPLISSSVFSPLSHKLNSLPAPVTILQDGMASLHHGPLHIEGVPFNLTAPAPPQPGFIPQYQAEDQSYQSMPALSPTLQPPGMPPQIPFYTPMEMPPQTSPQMPPQMPPQNSLHMHPHMPPHMPPHIPQQIHGLESTPTPPSPQSPSSHAPPPQMDFYDNMAQMVGFIYFL